MTLLKVYNSNNDNLVKIKLNLYQHMKISFKWVDVTIGLEILSNDLKTVHSDKIMQRVSLPLGTSDGMVILYHR